jgi:hypothetical protein
MVGGGGLCPLAAFGVASAKVSGSVTTALA